jgi:hypothetical protein
MQTLDDLLSGKLKGVKSLTISCELTKFPNEILELADTLEFLDLSNNNLSELPENFSNLHQLKIAFFSNNNFTIFPKVLFNCKSLTMIGFRANKIIFIPENSLPIKLQWLILTNNCIKQLPKSIGNCLLLQKVGLAGNEIEILPIEMSNCKNIELLRLSANKIQEIPNWLLKLPKLSWLAFAGNPCSENINSTYNLKVFNWNEITLTETLGQGASGIISKAILKLQDVTTHVAIKIFKGDITSDGLPIDEMNACIHADLHSNLVNVLGKLSNHPDNKLGLILELIPPTYKNLAYPPNYQTCTRDTFEPEILFEPETILTICNQIADASKHLHFKGILHGDLYGHNILIDKKDNIKFGDFGAATIYNKLNYFNYLEKIEVRAFGCLMDDLLVRSKQLNKKLTSDLVSLKNRCLSENATERPLFNEIFEILQSFS